MLVSYFSQSGLVSPSELLELVGAFKLVSRDCFLVSVDWLIELTNLTYFS